MTAPETVETATTAMAMDPGSEVSRSSPSSSPSRRELIVGAIGSGFAMSVRPVSAGTLHTDATGLDAEDVRIPTGTGDIPGYRAVPKGHGGRLPLLLVVHEIFGVHEHIKDVCRRLAKQGYLAIAPELFVRQGDVSKLTDFNDIRKIVAQVSDAQVLADLDSTVGFAKSSGAADVARLGITGFCWGGRIAWLYAAHSPTLKSAVAWYGRLDGDREPLHPRHPVDVAAALHAPVLGLYGGQDQSIPEAQVAAMRRALASGPVAAQRSEIKVFPQAGHAFFADYRPSYRADAAEDGWKRMLGWLRAHGVG
jgi:carboxymethylenebutenolidase